MDAYFVKNKEIYWGGGGKEAFSEYLKRVDRKKMVDKNLPIVLWIENRNDERMRRMTRKEGTR